MKPNKIQLIIRTVLLVAVFMLPALLHAQVQGDPPPGDGDPGAPIDGGLGLLLAAGAAYGVKKYREGRKKEETDKG